MSNDQELTGKKIYFDKESLEKLELLTLLHKGNVSAAVREAVNEAVVLHKEELKQHIEKIKKVLE